MTAVRRAPAVLAETSLQLTERTAALKAKLDAMPGALATPMAAPRAVWPSVLIYKVMGKMFAILAMRNIENVILKCDEAAVEILQAQFDGIGHRSHLDRRFWISVALNSDVPAFEVERLAVASYALVCAGLTRKQKAELAASSG